MPREIKNFNWNVENHSLINNLSSLPAEPTSEQILHTTIVSEDLRDGLHGSEIYPSLKEIMPYVHALSHVGIDRMTVGIFPGESEIVNSTIKQILRSLDRELPHITPIVLCLATSESLKWTLDCKEINPKLEALVFMGSSPIRRLVQNWSMGFILKQMELIISQATSKGLPVIGATEHTTQTPPDELESIIKIQVNSGASSFCIADTVGIARPLGAFRITNFVRTILDESGFSHIPVEWHGHRDLGNDLQNALMSICGGASRIHTVARGVGERAGNTSLEALLLNFDAILQDHNLDLPWRVDNLLQTLQLYEDLTNTDRPDHGPLGKRHSRTSLGIHADAIEKIHKLVDSAKTEEEASSFREMAHTIYSAVDSTRFGGKLESGIGPWSGKKNVYLTLRYMGISSDTIDGNIINDLLHQARLMGRELSNDEIKQIITK